MHRKQGGKLRNGSANPCHKSPAPQVPSDSSSEDDTSHPYVDLISLINNNVSKQESETDSEDEISPPKRPKLKSKDSPTKKLTELEHLDGESGTDDANSAKDDSESDVLAEESDSENGEDKDDDARVLIFGESDDEDAIHKNKKDDESDYYKQHLESSFDDRIQEMENKPQINEILQWPVLVSLRHTCRSITDTSDNFFVPKQPIKKKLTAENLRNSHHVRRMVIDNWIQLQKGNKNSRKDDDKEFFTPLQRELFTLFNSYIDVCYTDSGVLKTSSDIQHAYCLHAVNHVLRSRAKVLLNTARLKQMTPEQRELTDYRDQGITRPKVLILLPFKETALRVINIMLELFRRGSKFEVSYKKRFRDEFSKGEDDTNEQAFLKKPEDHQCLFAGNTDEHFRIGIALLRNSVRLYAPFYSSDIIVASPLGLRTIIGAEGERHHEHDFLSSIELLIMDQVDIFMMQNWEHILHIFDHLNLTPKDSHGADFSRVRNFSLDGRNKFYRQTITVSSVSLPQISSIFTKSCWNYRGCVSTERMAEKGSICAISKQLPQVFHKLSPTSLVESSEARFRFFIERIYRQYKDPSMSHTLIYVPQYFDYVRLRNYMRKQRKDGAGPIFGHINDYSTLTEAGKTKRRFFTGKCPLMLYTERFHFYNRVRIRGMRHLVFYELPTYPHFYAELCNMMRDSRHSDGVASAGSVIVMYSKFDTRKLAATVGLSRCRELQSSPKNVHMFVTGANAD